jgi:hypothetical protein
MDAWFESVHQLLHCRLFPLPGGGTIARTYLITAR